MHCHDTSTKNCIPVARQGQVLDQGALGMLNVPPFLRIPNTWCMPLLKLSRNTGIRRDISSNPQTGP
jgi:hypothetical protein